MADPSFTFTAQVRPVCELGLSDVRQAEPDEWLDVSCYVHECELFRGRDRFTDRFQPGTATITFKNTTGWADLVGSPAVVATQTLRPGRPIRVGVEGPWDGALSYVRWLWRGWVDQTTPQYHPVEHDVVIANCVDALGEAGSAPAPQGPYQGANESADARIHRVLDAVEWFSTKRKIDSSATLVQGTSLGGLGIDLMGQAADSTGGVIYGDTVGDVVFRDIDWLLYDPDVPPDATIGNVDAGTPGIPYVPGYINPGTGHVYDPTLPPIGPGTSITVCAGPGQGTLLEQGDGVEVFVQDGRIYYRGAGQLWDLGEFTGGCVEITTTVPPNGGPLVPPSITPVDKNGTAIGPTEDGEEIPSDAQPALIELLASTQSGEVDAAQGNTVLGPVTPGLDCWLVVLLTTVDGLENASPLSPSIEGGPTEWLLVEKEDAGPVGGASSFIWVNDAARVDPGTFSVVVDWAGETRSHACTLWRVRQMNSDYRTRLDAGLVLRATTDSTPLEPEPGDGPQTVTLATGAPL